MARDSKIPPTTPQSPIDKNSQRAIQMIAEQLNELQDMVDEAHLKRRIQGSYSSISREKLRRWKSRTARQISEFIHPEEGKKLENLVKGKLLDNPDLAVDLYREFLSVLAEELERHPQNLLYTTSAEETDQVSQKADPRKVFVVHGRNEAARRAMFSFLRALGLDPIEWSEAVHLTGKGSPFVGEILDTAFTHAQAVVVLFTGDDVARLGTRYLTANDPPYEREPTPQARPNVLFEAGLAFGRNPERTILVTLGNIRPFSDVVGRHII
jgi:predicted nucleotide-binding protein